MKILELLNKKYLSIIFFSFLFCLNIQAEEEPVDIWNIEKKKIEETSAVTDLTNEDNSISETPQSNIYEMQSKKEIDDVQIDTTLSSKQTDIIGLYDPEDYDLKIDMWSNSNGDQLKYIF